MRKTLKALFAIVDPTSRATGASHLTRSEQTQNITATAAITDLLSTTASKAAQVARSIDKALDTPSTTRTWTHEIGTDETNLFNKLMKG